MDANTGQVTKTVMIPGNEFGEGMTVVVVVVCVVTQMDGWMDRRLYQSTT